MYNLKITFVIVLENKNHSKRVEIGQHPFSKISRVFSQINGTIANTS